MLPGTRIGDAITDEWCSDDTVHFRMEEEMAKLLAEKAEVENRNEMLERQMMALQADLVSCLVSSSCNEDTDELLLGRTKRTAFDATRPGCRRRRRWLWRRQSLALTGRSIAGGGPAIGRHCC